MGNNESVFNCGVASVDSKVLLEIVLCLLSSGGVSFLAASFLAASILAFASAVTYKGFIIPSIV